MFFPVVLETHLAFATHRSLSLEECNSRGGKSGGVSGGAERATSWGDSVFAETELVKKRSMEKGRVESEAASERPLESLGKPSKSKASNCSNAPREGILCASKRET